jgi:hypothetical protein
MIKRGRARSTRRPLKWDAIEAAALRIGFSPGVLALWVHRGQIPPRAKLAIFQETSGAIGFSDMEFPPRDARVTSADMDAARLEETLESAAPVALP